jgi:hypothetical protein
MEHCAVQKKKKMEHCGETFEQPNATGADAFFCTRSYLLLQTELSAQLMKRQKNSLFQKEKILKIVDPCVLLRFGTGCSKKKRCGEVRASPAARPRPRAPFGVLPWSTW